ncbi:hypothetical protein NEUTE1DRAFT_44810 [Neurospora tetrasperma FGSC 2508]|uniref:Cytochrome P450 n=1 Tax=Neurospora tetrasperma (strain FGSC 2508 / ATCC MYA-4615 / P0657) TaxID=510951 RepID=F8MPV8_NEUT8|nr:uncharacterized protein NEUTE1DRAFT_44810 [Neurospora tetrasperma FGSC 2508]EGO56388.1 hypothetical protein NEUTE1DRAFT_44810 [Neurospora tetrasperma FGSC 2508]EGZ70753.1 hypothetical protein NEUTE2DRAFT_67128 [Neurospora tetrasperma FGSC 2509]
MLIALLALFSLLIAYVLHHVLSHQTLLLKQIFSQTIFNTIQLARLIGPLDPYDPLTVPDPAIHDSNSASEISEAQARANQRIDDARSIIDFSYAGPKVELEDRLRLRALANSRLVAAFGINTSLTSSSVSVHKKFRKLASASINKSRADWQKLYGVCMDFLQREKARYGRTGIGLAECVRCLCFVVVLVSQFGADDKKVDKNLVKRITDEINAQWLKSKEDGGAVKTSDSLNHDLGMLFGNLKTSVAEENGTGKDTYIDPSEALGLIMPQYETLWRVVLLTYVTAYYRQFDKRSLKKRVKDIPSCLGNAATEKEALKLAMEGLRLYPSNNSIYRAATGPGPLKSADVQACHRDFNVWGRDALEFRPERFDNLTPLQEKAYFPFSLGSHKCPAFGGFGNRMVTMLVVSMGRALSPEAGKLNFKDAQLDNHVGISLPTGRDEMENWSWDMVRVQ